MDDNGLQAFSEQFAKPGWLIATFLLPFLFPKATTYCAELFEKFFEGAGATATASNDIQIEAAVNIDPGEQKLVTKATQLLLVAAKYTRPFLIGFLLLYVVFLIAAFAMTKTKPGFAVIFYLSYFVVALLYNLRERRKEFNKPLKKTILPEKLLRYIFISITYAHVVAFLYLLVHESFFSLLTFSGMNNKGDAFFLSLFLLLFPVLGILVIKDLVYPASTSLTRVLAFILSCCILTFLILFINHWYMVIGK